MRKRINRETEEASLAPTEPTTPTRRRRKATTSPETEQPEAAAAETPAAKAPRTTPPSSRRRRPEPEPEAPVKAVAEETKPARKRPSSRRRTAAEPAPEPQTEPAAETPEEDGDGLPVPIFRARKSKPAEPTPEPEPDLEPEAETEEEPGEPVLRLDDPSGLVAVLAWRTPSDTPRPTEVDEEAESGDAQLAPRRSRTRKRRDRKDREITAVAALEPAEPARRREERRRPEPEPEPAPPVVAKKTLPEAPKREPIPTPEDAPQVVLLEGVPTLVRQNRVYPPLFFFTNPSDAARVTTALEQVRMAADNGVHVFSILVEFFVDEAAVATAVENSIDLVRKLAEADPEAQVILRLAFAAPAGWDRRYPNGRYQLHQGGLAEPSVTDEEFWGVAEKCLSDFVTQIAASDVAGALMGLHLERGEWFSADGDGYDSSPAANQAFRQWLRLRYSDTLHSLRAAWFDGKVSFETVQVPAYSGAQNDSEDFVRTGRKQRRWVDYHLFLSDATVSRIESLAYTAKKASAGRFLVGVSYGYTFEWSHPASGHLSLGKLLRSPYLDYIAGPPSYRNRMPGESCPFPGPIDSFALNGKLYVSEEDFKTPISGRPEQDDFNKVMKTPQALESAHWRGAGAALAHGAGACWMDTWGNGWLNSPGIWKRGGAVRDALAWRIHAQGPPPDVAVFIDERSLAYLVDQRAFSVLVQNVREAMLRSGLSCGFYLLSDLAHRETFPESKLYVFVNAWDMRPEVRSAIKTRLQRDGKVLFWLYAAGLFEGGRESLERVREVTGIALRPQPFYSKPGTTLLNVRDPLCASLPQELVARGGQLEPSYFAIPEEHSTVLGEYAATGLPSFLVRRFKHEDPSQNWTSVFLGEPIVTPGLFRALGQLAGAHVWSFGNDVVHVHLPFLTVHCTGTGQRALALPDKWSVFDLVNRDWIGTESNSLRFHAMDGATHTFLLGIRSELENLMTKHGPDGLRLAQLPPRPENTLRPDSVHFDVPIMKLDAWVEESWSETLADDLLLKPSMLEVDTERAPAATTAESDDDGDERRGRRRRRRRRGDRPERGDRDRDRSPRDRSSGDSDTVNVLFRKRE